MRSLPFIAVALATGFTLGFTGVHAATLEAAGVLKKASEAMGATDLRSLRYSGSGTGGSFGQAYKPGGPWPKLSVPSFSRAINYETGSMSEDMVATRAEATGGGGGLPPFQQPGERRTSQFVSGNVAWNVAAGTATPAAASTERLHQLWITPHGVIKAAQRRSATLEWKVEKGRSLAAVSFEEPGRFRATAYINDKYLVERVESRLPNAVLGEVPVVTRYEEYQSFGPIMFPIRTIQTMDGSMVLDVMVRETQPNAAVAIQVPTSMEKPAPVRVTTDKAAEGVWFVAGGSHNSVAIEMKDHMLLVEAPLGDERTLAVIEAVNKLAPGKTVKAVVNSHNHFDHAGGLRAAVSTGARVIVHNASRQYFTRAFNTHSRISPDALTKSGKKAVLQGMGDKLVLSDGSRTVELHHIKGNTHVETLLMAWLPKERFLIQADAFTPTPKPPALANPFTVNLAENIDRLKLPVDRMLPLHGNVVPLAALHAAIGRK